MSATETMTVISEAIERELRRKGWTRYKLAQVTDISHATMHNICTGAHEPKVSNLVSIADALGVSIDSLLPRKKSSRKSREAVSVA